jgi:hypothetical protein
MNRYRLPAVLTGALIAVLAMVAVNMFTGGSGTRAEENAPIFEYPPYPPTPTIGTAPHGVVALEGDTAQSGATLFADGFDTPDALRRWEVADLQFVLDEERSVWTVSEGRLMQDRTTGARNPKTHETAALTGDASWTDYTISAKFYDAANGTFGLIARSSGNSYYRYRAYTDAFSQLPSKQLLEKVVDGTVTTLATFEGPSYQQRSWNSAALRVAGSQISVWLNGELVLETTDSDLAAGRAGVTTLAIGELYVDDVSITTP